MSALYNLKINLVFHRMEVTVNLKIIDQELKLRKLYLLLKQVSGYWNSVDLPSTSRGLYYGVSSVSLTYHGIRTMAFALLSV